MDIYQEVTNRIIAQMDQGYITWRRPWCSASTAVSHVTGKPYSLLNQMLLSLPGEYAIFKQVQVAGSKVRKGEQSQMIVFRKWLEDEETCKKKEDERQRVCEGIPVEQTDGI